MANMGYCRFRNTLQDLRDCYYNMDSNNVSEEEFEARKQLVELCQSIMDEYEYRLNEDYKDVCDDEEDD